MTNSFQVCLTAQMLRTVLEYVPDDEILDLTISSGTYDVLREAAAAEVRDVDAAHREALDMYGAIVHATPVNADNE